MLSRSVSQLLKHSYGVRYMATPAKIDLYEQIDTYPYLKTFLFEKEDPIKERWEFIKDWSAQCASNPEMEQREFKLLRQRYELAPLYEDESLSEGNSFLKDIFERIKDPEEEGQINRKTLSDAQFEVTKRVMNENISVNEFISKIPELMRKAKSTVSTLRYKKFDFERFEKDVQAWATYRFLSYGHPSMVDLHRKMIDTGGDLTSDDIRDVVHYMKKQRSYSFYNKGFKDTLVWLSRMNWVFPHKGIFEGELMDHFVVLCDRYERMKEVLESDGTLERCAYYQNTKEGREWFVPETQDVEVWLKDISKKDYDPLVAWLKENVSRDTMFQELQNAIVNRYQLDIGGLFDKHESLLKSLLHNKYLHQLRPDAFDAERHKVLIGTELTDEYLDELKAMIDSTQEEFLAARK